MSQGHIHLELSVYSMVQEYNIWKYLGFLSHVPSHNVILIVLHIFPCEDDWDTDFLRCSIKKTFL